jgi:nucleotide-binding universal stress UspA family protein
MFKKILCPLDLSERSFKAMIKAAEIAKTCDSKLVLLHISEKFMSEKEMIMLRVSAEHYQEYQREIALKAKEQILSEFEKLNLPEIEMEIVLREGIAKKDIAPIAEELGADLIVLTNTGGDFIHEKIMGTTADAVVKHAKIDVLRVYV